MSQCPSCSNEMAPTAMVCDNCGHVRTLQLKVVVGSPYELEQLLGDSLETRILSLPVAEPPPDNTMLELLLVLPASKGEVRFMTQACGAEEEPSRPGKPWNLQLRLLDLDPSKTSLLEEALAAEYVPQAPVRPPARSVRPPAAPPPVETAAPRAEPPAVEAPPPVSEPPRAEPSPVATAPPPPIPRPEAAGEPTDDVDAMIADMLKPWKPKPEPKPEPLQEEAPVDRTRKRLPEKVAKELTDFTMQLVQAVTKTSYYTADHQAAEKSKEGLYSAFTTVLDDRREITYMARSTPEKKSVLIYGLFDEPAELSQAMLKGMAELYSTKLTHWFESKGLYSISFKRTLREDEFHRFVDLLAQPVSLTPGFARRYSEQLAALRIQNISIVFQEDRIKGRHLSWRVEAALTRLGKDLSILPLFQHLDAEELRRVRLQVIQDIVRPLRQLHLLLELLENCDLISDKMKEFKGHSLDESELLHAMPRSYFPQLLDSLAQDLTSARHDKTDKAERLTQIVRRIAERLTGAEAASVEAILRELYAGGSLSFDELPGFLQAKLVGERKAHQFLSMRERFHEKFEHTSRPDEYRSYLDFFTLVLPELMSENHHVAAMRIAESITEHRRSTEGFATRQDLAAQWLEGLEASPTGIEFRRLLLGSDKVARDFLFGLFRLLGIYTNRILFDALAESKVRSTRQEICQFMAERRALTMQLLPGELEKKDVPWYYLRNLILLLGEIGKSETVSMVTPFLSHEHPKVRLEAMTALRKLDPKNAEDRLMFALSDPDASVRQAAVENLVALGCSDAAFFDFCRGLLEDPEETGEKLAVAVCNLMRHYEKGPGHEEAVQVLLSVLKEEAEQKKGLTSLLGRPADSANVAVKVAACHALGRLMAKAAEPTLKLLTKSRDETLKRAAATAMHRIQSG